MDSGESRKLKIGYLMQAGAPDLRRQPLTGAGRHVWEVCQELRKRGHEVRLLATWDREQIWRTEDFTHFERVQTPWLDAGPLRLFERTLRRVQYELKLPYAAFFASLRFAMACRRELFDCDVLYERMGWFGYGGALASRWLDIPLILEVNGDHLAEFEALGIAPGGLQKRLSVALTAWSTRQTSHVVATGEGWRKAFLERWQADPSHVSVIENGSALLKLLPREDLTAFRSVQNADAAIQIAFVGGFQPWQGIPNLLHAFRRILAQGINARLVIIGAGTPEETEELKRLVEELDLKDDVVFTGYLSSKEVAEQLAGSDIAVSSYCGRREFSGLKLLDYKAAGLPTVATGQNGEPSVLQHGRTGCIVPPCDEECLAEALLHLCTDPDLRRRMGRAARREAEEQHGWQHTAEKIERILLRTTKEGVDRFQAKRAAESHGR